MSRAELTPIMRGRATTSNGAGDESVVPGTARSDLHDSLTHRFLAGDVVSEPTPPAREALPGASEDDLLRKLRIVAARCPTRLPVSGARV